MKIKNELKEDKLISEQENWNFIERFYIYFIRIFTTIGNLAVLLGSILCVVLAATKGKELKSDSNFLKFLYSYLVSITMGGTSIICPIFFKIFTSFQKLRAETRMNQVIGWRVALRFLSITAVFITIFLEISKCHDRDIIPSSSSNSSDELQAETHFSCTCENPLFTCWPTVLGQECYRLLGSAPFPFIISFYGPFFLNSLTKPLIPSRLRIIILTLTLFPARNSRATLSFHFSFLSSENFSQKTLSITLN